MIRRPPRSTRTEHSFPTRRSSDLLDVDDLRVLWQRDAELARVVRDDDGADVAHHLLLLRCISACSSMCRCCAVLPCLSSPRSPTVGYASCWSSGTCGT